MSASAICDFCTCQPVAFVYPAADFDADIVASDGTKVAVGSSQGGWAACAACAKAIENNDRARLAARCAEHGAVGEAIRVGIMSKGEAMRHAMRFNSGFFTARRLAGGLARVTVEPE